MTTDLETRNAESVRSAIEAVVAQTAAQVATSVTETQQQQIAEAVRGAFAAVCQIRCCVKRCSLHRHWQATSG